jgi:hypothetical protein
MVWEKREAEGVMKNSVSPADYVDLDAGRDVVYGNGGDHGSHC